jgi:hypothetical protein
MSTHHTVVLNTLLTRMNSALVSIRVYHYSVFSMIGRSPSMVPHLYELADQSLPRNALICIRIGHGWFIFGLF